MEDDHETSQDGKRGQILIELVRQAALCEEKYGDDGQDILQVESSLLRYGTEQAREPIGQNQR